MTQNELDKIIAEHQLWLSDPGLGKRADLSGTTLRGAYLSGADLSCADIRDSNLRGADLSGANLSDANLRGAVLRGANLRGVNLRGADLRDANLSDANLRCANLRDVDLIYVIGFDVKHNQDVKCEFFVGASKEWDIITIGCKTHTTMEWVSYLELSEDLYLNDCYNKDEYDRCIIALKEMINYIEGV